MMGKLYYSKIFSVPVKDSGNANRLEVMIKEIFE